MGWRTIALDLRPIAVGIRAIEVRLGTTIGRLFEAGSFLFEELDDLGRMQLPLRFRLNSGPAARNSVFSADTETLTVEEDFRPVTPGHAHMHPSLAAFGAAGGLPPWSVTALAPGSPRSWPSSPVGDNATAPATGMHLPDGSVPDEPPIPDPPAVSPSEAVPVATDPEVSQPSETLPPCNLTQDTVATTTTSTTAFPGLSDLPVSGCTSTTTTTPPATAVTIACAVHGDRPRCVRIHPQDHIAQALWSILSEPGRTLPEASSWTLAACPRSFPDRRTGRLILTTLSILDPFTCVGPSHCNQGETPF